MDRFWTVIEESSELTKFHQKMFTSRGNYLEQLQPLQYFCQTLCGAVRLLPATGKEEEERFGSCAQAHTAGVFKLFYSGTQLKNSLDVKPKDFYRLQ